MRYFEKSSETGGEVREIPKLWAERRLQHGPEKFDVFLAAVGSRPLYRDYRRTPGRGAPSSEDAMTLIRVVTANEPILLTTAAQEDPLGDKDERLVNSVIKRATERFGRARAAIDINNGRGVWRMFKLGLQHARFVHAYGVPAGKKVKILERYWVFQPDPGIRWCFIWEDVPGVPDYGDPAVPIHVAIWEVPGLFWMNVFDVVINLDANELVVLFHIAPPRGVKDVTASEDPFPPIHHFSVNVRGRPLGRESNRPGPRIHAAREQVQRLPLRGVAVDPHKVWCSIVFDIAEVMQHVVAEPLEPDFELVAHSESGDEFVLPVTPRRWRAQVLESEASI